MKLNVYILVLVFFLNVAPRILAADSVIIPKEYKILGKKIVPGVYKVFRRENSMVWVMVDGRDYLAPSGDYVNIVPEMNGIKPESFVILERELRKPQFPYFVFPGLRQVFAVGSDGTLILSDETSNGTDLFVATKKDYTPSVPEWNRIRVGDLVHVEELQEMFWSPRLKVPPGKWPVEAIGANGDVILRNPVDHGREDLLVTRENYKIVNLRNWESDANPENVRLFLKLKETKQVIPVIAIRSEGRDIGVVRVWEFRDALKFRNSLVVYKIADSELLNMDSMEEYQKSIEMDKILPLKMPGSELQKIYFPPDLVKTSKSLLEFVNRQFKETPDCSGEFSVLLPKE